MEQDLKILNELLDRVEELRQRTGVAPGRGHPSSFDRLREELMQAMDDAAQEKLKGKALRRRSGELFRRIVALYPAIWEQ